MSKLLLTLLAAVYVSSAAVGQSYEGTIQYDKKKQQALVIEYAYPAEAVQNAIVQKLEKMGYKPKEEKGLLNRDKGFLVFKNIYITDISKERLDYLVKVERKSRKESDESVMYLVIMRGDQNALSVMESYDVGSAKAFLNNLIPEIEAANLELQIKAQQERLTKAEKKLSDLKDDQASLEKKLEQNRKDQDDTQKDIETQKQALGVLIDKRRSN